MPIKTSTAEYAKCKNIVAKIRKQLYYRRHRHIRLMFVLCCMAGTLDSKELFLKRTMVMAKRHGGVIIMTAGGDEI